jgi:hypothetical protein
MSNCNKKISQFPDYTGTSFNDLIIPVVDTNVYENFNISYLELTNSITTSLSGLSISNIYLSGTTLIVEKDNGTSLLVDLSSLLFTGNTSATCINDLYVHNLGGCSPINVLTEMIVNESLSATTLYGNGYNLTDVDHQKLINVNGDADGYHLSQTYHDLITGDSYSMVVDFNAHTGDTSIHYVKSDINIYDLGVSAHTHNSSDIEFSGITDNFLLQKDGDLITGLNPLSLGSSYINIDYGGTPTYPIDVRLPNGFIQIPNTSTFGDKTYNLDPLVVVEELGNIFSDNGVTSFTFTDLGYIKNSLYFNNMNSLTSLSFPSLTSIGYDFYLSSLPILTTLSCPLLSLVGRDFKPSTFSLLTTLDFPSLKRVPGNFDITSMSSITTFNFPSLEFVGGNIQPQGFSLLKVMDFPSLNLVNHFNPTSMTSLTALTLSALTTTMGGFYPSAMASLPTLSCPSLVSVAMNFTPSTMASLTNLSFPSLTSVGGYFSPNSMASLSAMSFSALTSVTNYFAPGTMASLVSMDFPVLTYIGSYFRPTTMASLTTMNFPVLTTVNSYFNPATMGSITTISFSALTGVTSYITINTMANLTTINLPSLVSVGSYIYAYTSLGNVTNVTIGSVGVTKLINGNVTISGQKLTLSSVEQILSVLASLDGTGGTTAWSAGKTLNISGGTSAGTAALSPAGLANKNIITARGATVTMNP